MKYKSSELIINEDGSIFHLKLKPEDISDTILLVGDPGRVDLIGEFFEKIEITKHNREFKTITGYYQGKRITVLSSGIGTDNIDIVINELDALANINLRTRELQEERKQLKFIRIGTSGGIQEDIPVHSFVFSGKAIGFDNLPFFYGIKPENTDMTESLKQELGWAREQPFPYIVDGSENLISLFRNREFIEGINISAPGFYGPQGRQLRIPLADPALNNKIKNFKFQGQKITNFEMESSAIYALAKFLGHQAITVCAIIANRANKEFAGDYKPTIKKLVKKVLDSLTE